MQRKVTSLSYFEFTVADGNFDTTRSPIDRIIIHTVVGTAQSAIDKFGTIGTKVSSHYIVGLDGKIYHGLEEYNTAYHAGDYPMNQRSIGIEHEDNGDYNGVRPDVLYTESAKLVADICKFYNIPIDRQHILKHSEVSDQPTGCPDTLDIDRIVNEASSLSPAGTYVDADTFGELVTKSTKYDEFVKIGYTNADQVTEKINSLQTQINDCNTQIGTLTKQVQDLTTEVQLGKNTTADITAELQKTLTSDSTAIDNGIKAEQERDQLQQDMELIAQYLQAKDSTKQSILASIDDLKTQISTSQQTQQKTVTNFQLFLNEFIKRFIAKK